MDKLTQWYTKPKNIINLTNFLDRYIHFEPFNNLFYNYEDAKMTIEDIIQDTFLSLYKRYGENDFSCKPKTMIFETAKNKAIDELRRRKRKPVKTIHIDYYDEKNDPLIETILENNSIPTDNMPILRNNISPEKYAELEELNDVLNTKIGELPEINYHTIILTMRGYSRDEIAEKLKIPSGTVKSKIRLDRIKIKNRLKKYYGKEVYEELGLS